MQLAAISRSSFTCFVTFAVLTQSLSTEDSAYLDAVEFDTTDSSNCSVRYKVLPPFCRGEGGSVDSGAETEECAAWVECVNGRNTIEKVQATINANKTKFERGNVLALYIVVPIIFVVVKFLLRMFRWCWDRNDAEAPAEAHASQGDSDFFKFQRPPVTSCAPSGGYFNMSHCPPVSVKSLQSWYSISRSSIYSTFIFIVPGRVFTWAVHMALNSGILWCAFYLASKHKFAKEAFVTFHGDAHWYLKSDNYWKITASDLSLIGNVLKTVVAFFLLYMCRQRLRWYETLKTKIWLIKRNVELVSFLTAAFLVGDDEEFQRARYDIHRWLISAMFFAFRGQGVVLQAYSAQHLKNCGMLSADEADHISRLLRPGAHRTRLSADLGGRAASKQTVHSAFSESDSVTERRGKTEKCCVARDCLLWWVQLRVLAAVKQNMLEKEHKKKLLGFVWRARDCMEDFANESDRRPMFLWIALMQLMVDIYISQVPFDSVATMYRSHIWSLPSSMWRCFFISFFYDVVFELMRMLASPYGSHSDSLNLDPILVTAERVSFFNCAQNEHSDIPNPLHQVWMATKNKKGKDEDSEKTDKQDEKSKKQNIEGSAGSQARRSEIKVDKDSHDDDEEVNAILIKTVHPVQIEMTSLPTEHQSCIG